MHKFFCSFNQLTQKYELSHNKNLTNVFWENKSNTLARNSLIDDIKILLQELYKNIVVVKEKENTENKLNILDETELLISNLYYSFFASPLDLPEKNIALNGNELAKALEIASRLQKLINIPEYNRVISIVYNNIFSIL